MNAPVSGGRFICHSRPHMPSRLTPAWNNATRRAVKLKAVGVGASRHSETSRPFSRLLCGTRIARARPLRPMTNRRTVRYGSTARRLPTARSCAHMHHWIFCRVTVLTSLLAGLTVQHGQHAAGAQPVAPTYSAVDGDPVDLSTGLYVRTTV